MATVTNYAQAGVDRAAADRLVEKIAVLAKSTKNRRVRESIGGYASIYELDKKRWLAASTDGVGTKLKLAFDLNRHDTIGIDLVAMSVNDLLCVGAEPLFFLDYFATGKLQLGTAEKVLAGIVEGCKQAGCALVGGETAEMPDFYRPGEYDLGGFAVGSLSPDDALPKTDIKPGDVILGVASSGCHSNGYSLLRKLLPGGAEGKRLAAELLTPTRIYAHSFAPLLRRGMIKGLAHITGSGFLNIPRISEKVSYSIQLPPASERPEIFDWVRSASGLPMEELYQTFNMGIGMIVVVDVQAVAQVKRVLRRLGETVWHLGEVVKRPRGEPSQIFLWEGDSSVTLSY